MRRRRTRFVSCTRICFRPSCERGDLCRAQRRIISKFPDRRIGKPRRHRSCFHGVTNRIRERPRLLVALEWHGRNGASPVATLAVPLKNRKNVAIKHWRLSPGPFLFIGTPEQARQDGQHENRTQYSRYFHAKCHRWSLGPRRTHSTAVALTVYYWRDSAAGCSHEKRKPLFSRNCAARSPGAGTTIGCMAPRINESHLLSARHAISLLSHCRRRQRAPQRCASVAREHPEIVWWCEGPPI